MAVVASVGSATARTVQAHLPSQIVKDEARGVHSQCLRGHTIDGAPQPWIRYRCLSLAVGLKGRLPVGHSRSPLLRKLGNLSLHAIVQNYVQEWSRSVNLAPVSKNIARSAEGPLAKKLSE